MMDDLSALEAWTSGLLSKLSPGARRQLLQVIARDLRRSQQARIAAQRNPDGSAYVPRKTGRGKPGNKHQRDKVGRVKRLAMFRKLRTARYLRIDVEDSSVSLGYNNALSRVARVHQDGERAPVEPGGPLVRYPVRTLLGFDRGERELIRDRLLRYLNR